MSSTTASFTSLRHALRAAAWAVVVGILTGTASALFLWSLDEITSIHRAHGWLLWTLPALGLLVGWIYEKHGKGAGRGNNFLLEEIHHPREAVPLRMVPFVLLGTLLTHLAGGSAGREGTAVQMGGSLADGVSRWADVDARTRRLLLFAGIAGGFGAVFGTPWAGDSICAGSGDYFPPSVVGFTASVSGKFRGPLHMSGLGH